MGFDGKYYTRDVKDGYKRTAKGHSVTAEQQMSTTGVDLGLLPLNRRISSRSACPVVLNLDCTGSMGNPPLIYIDKMPMMAGQVVQCSYLPERPEISFSLTGDVTCDTAPIQICDFCEMKHLDTQFKRAWLERGGGFDDCESYEFLAYFYARMCDLPNAKTPFFIFTADEGFRPVLYPSELNRHFGGKHERIDASKIFTELKKKFMGNVFLIHRTYNGGTNATIVQQWEKVLGEKHIIQLNSDQAIADVTLGLFALRTGARTLDTYLEDLKTTRAVPQTDGRVLEVRESLCRVEVRKPGSNPSEFEWL